MSMAKVDSLVHCSSFAMKMFLRHINKALDKNRVRRQPQETVLDAEDEVVHVTATPGCQNRIQKLTDINVSLAPVVMLSSTLKAEATHASDADIEHRPIRTNKQRRQSDPGHIRQIMKRQSPNSKKNNFMTPNVSGDLSNIENCNGDGDQTIAILENECSNLTHIMCLLRESHCKYTEEWFVLENRLKIASEELDAAREDRELHFLSSSSGFSTGSDSGVFDDINSTTQVLPPREDIEEYNKNFQGNEFAADDCIKVPELSVGTQPESDAISITNKNPTIEVEVNTSEVPVMNSQVDHENGLSCNTSCRQICKGTAKFYRRSSKYQQIESELQRCTKFTPAWFQLKEELVELTIELANAKNCLDDSDDESSIEGELEKVHDAPLEINVLLVSGDARGSATLNQSSSANGITSSVVSSPPLSPISQGSLSPTQDSDTLSPSAETGYHDNRNRIADFTVDTFGSNPSNNSVPTHHRSTSGKSGSSNKNKYCYSFNDMDSDDENGKVQSEEENRNMLTTRLKIEHASLTEELKRLPQYSKDWFEVKMKAVGISEKIVRLQLEEVTTEVLTENHFSGCDGDGESLGGDSSKNVSSSGWSSVDVWSESEDEIWSYADELDVGMVSEALKQHSSLYIDQSSSFEDELLFIPQLESTALIESDQQDTAERSLINDFESGHTAEPVHEPVLIQAMVRGMIQRGTYLRQRRMAIRIQSWQRSSFVRSSYKQILTNVTIIQGVVRRWLTQRNPPIARDAMMRDYFIPEWEVADCSLKAMQDDCCKREGDSSRKEFCREKELEGAEQAEGSQTVNAGTQIAFSNGSHSEEAKISARLEDCYDDTFIPKKEILNLAPIVPMASAKTSENRPIVRNKTLEEEKMKILSSESLSLSRRIKSLPRYSPEWTLTKIELNLVIEELEYLNRINDVMLQGCLV